jgi:hypothetical protein|nr:hypothetical protein [uncultured Acetatifactor sp.]
MWAIQLFDGRASIIYLREELLDGRILLFDKEEAALRFIAGIREKLEPGLRVRLRPIRYSDDPRKDKPYKVPDSRIAMLTEYILARL